MSRKAALEAEELRTMINSFRCSDLVSLLASVGRNKSGRKNELQARALDILKKAEPDINLDYFKRKIKEIYKASQDEAKQTHNLEIQQQMMAHNMSGGRMQHVLAAQHANAMQQQRPMNNMSQFVGMPSQTYHHPTQRGNLASNVAVYQGLPGNAYPTSNIYGQANAQHIQMSNAPIYNFGGTTYVIQPTYLAPANNAKFRKLPFYNIKHEVLKPTLLAANSHSSLPNAMRTNSASQEFHCSFVLSCDMASDIAMNRDISNGKSDYNVQAQLRISAFDNVSGNITEHDDYLPLGLVVRLNQRQCTLPVCSPNTRSGTESRRIPRPINITPQIRISPMNANHLVINWAPEAGKTFFFSLNLVEKLSSDYLLNKLKERPTISIDVTKATIRQQYKRVIDDDDDNDEANADDDDIATTIVRVSLVCPLAKFRMMFPAKGKNCSHLQCFDGSAYICLNEKKPMWMCPVCNRTLYFDDLIIDQYFLDVLQNEELSADCQEVQLLVDGTWKSYDEEASNNDDKKSASSPGAPSPSSSKQDANNEDSVEMVASEDGDRKESTLADLHFDSNAATGGPVVDLTEEEEESQDNTMNVATNDTEAANDTEAPKTCPAPAPTPPANNQPAESNDEPAVETNSDVEKSNNQDDNLQPAAVPAPTAVLTDAPSSTVSSSGYISPNIISLMDSPSPSPPPPAIPASPPNSIAALNIEDS